MKIFKGPNGWGKLMDNEASKNEVMISSEIVLVLAPIIAIAIMAFVFWLIDISDQAKLPEVPVKNPAPLNIP